jgi:hypothetical protein
MRTTQILIALLAISFLTSCRQGYKVENNQVYYEYWNEADGQGKRLIESADANTFQKLDFDCHCSFDFGKDKLHLYMDGEPISNIDPNTFKFIGNYVFTDKNAAYFFGFYNNINDCAIKGVEPGKLQLLNYPWSKAENILIHGADTLLISDIDDFVPLDKDWGKTKKFVVYDSKILEGADPETFKIINSYTGKDKNNVYEFGKVKK